MHESIPRAATVSLAVAGAVTLLLALWAPIDGDMAGRNLQWLTAASGLALLVAVGAASWRLPAIAAALLGKGSYLLAWQASGGVTAALEAALMLLLAFAGVVFWIEARREARWNGGQFLRLEP
jgi:hypothetical protein